MPDLHTLRAAADAATAAFDAACAPHYRDGRWGAYRAIDARQSVPAEVLAALDAELTATHAYYRARDGETGFLGSKGL